MREIPDNVGKFLIMREILCKCGNFFSAACLNMGKGSRTIRFSGQEVLYEL